MKHYLLPENGNLYKACLHSHSTLSDGYHTPERMKEIYKERGYHILSITDHGKLIDHSALSDDDFIMLTGIEYWVGGGGAKIGDRERAMEFNLFARDEHNTSLECFAAKPKEFSLEYMQFVIDTANANGFLVSLNHPVCSFLSTEFIRKLDGLMGFEIYNQDAILCGVNEYGIAMYDELLRYGKPWCCVASDDSHGTPSAAYPAQGFVMIKADELKYGKIIDALEAGNFYASTGPVIEELYIEDGEVHIKCSPVKYIGMEASNHRGGARRAKLADEYLTEATFPIKEGVIYIRFDLQDENGNWAHTRAYSPDGNPAIPSTPFFEA